MMRRTLLTALLFAGAISIGLGQNGKSPHFEVAVIKRCPDNFPRYCMGAPWMRDPGHLLCSNLTVRRMVAGLYADGHEERVSGPSWIDDKYLIKANYPPNSPADQYMEMSKNLLAERFHLTFHRVTKSTSAYQITVLPGGPRLTRSSPDQADDTSPELPDEKGLKAGSGGYPIAPRGNMFVAATSGGVTRMTFKGVPMTLLADRLGYVMTQANGASGRVNVLDRTGLEGNYDFHLAFEASSGNGVVPADLTGNIAAALRKQLGLKLSGTKTSFDYIVIDHVDREPTPN